MFLTLNGQWSSSESIELVNDATAYEPGSAQEFDIEAPSFGGITSIDVRLAGGSQGRSLKFERIEITDKDSGKKLNFIHDEAVTVDSGAVNVKVHLNEAQYKVRPGRGVHCCCANVLAAPRRMPDGVAPRASSTRPQIALVTDANAGNAATFDGDVYVTLYGMDGQSEEVKLTLPDSGARPQLSNGTSVVANIKSVDVGDLRYVHTRFDFCGSVTEVSQPCVMPWRLCPLHWAQELKAADGGRRCHCCAHAARSTT